MTKRKFSLGSKIFKRSLKYKAVQSLLKIGLIRQIIQQRLLLPISLLGLCGIIICAYCGLLRSDYNKIKIKKTSSHSESPHDSSQASTHEPEPVPEPVSEPVSEPLPQIELTVQSVAINEVVKQHRIFSNDKLIDIAMNDFNSILVEKSNYFYYSEILEINEFISQCIDNVYNCKPISEDMSEKVKNIMLSYSNLKDTDLYNLNLIKGLYQYSSYEYINAEESMLNCISILESIDNDTTKTIFLYSLIAEITSTYRSSSYYQKTFKNINLNDQHFSYILQLWKARYNYYNKNYNISYNIVEDTLIKIKNLNIECEDIIIYLNLKIMKANLLNIDGKYNEVATLIKEITEEFHSLSIDQLSILEKKKLHLAIGNMCIKFMLSNESSSSVTEEIRLIGVPYLKGIINISLPDFKEEKNINILYENATVYHLLGIFYREHKNVNDMSEKYFRLANETYEKLLFFIKRNPEKYSKSFEKKVENMITQCRWNHVV